MKKHSSFLLSIASLLLISPLMFAQIPSPQREIRRITPGGIRGNEMAIANQYLVVLRDDALGSQPASRVAEQLAGQFGGGIIHVYDNAINGFSVRLSEAAAIALSRNPLVSYVEEDAVIDGDSASQAGQSGDGISLLRAQPNAPWGLDRIDQPDLPLNNSYVYTNAGSGVHVYVIGTGIRFSHEDFGGRALLGIDFVGDGQAGNDCNGLGTGVAAVIGGATYGVAKEATLYSVRAFNCNNSTTLSNLIAAIDWVTGNRINPAVAHVSISTGGNATIDTAVANSITSGVTYALAAGDINVDAGTRSPARVATAITVGGTSIIDSRVTTSNFGASLDLFAPGQDILTASHFDDTSNILRTGTALAAGHVAGAAARYLHSYPADPPSAVSQAITSTASPGKVLNPGTGSPNLLLFVEGTDDVNGKIAFHSLRNGNVDIYIINEDGTGEARLTTNAANDFEPHWSPDGTKIAFVSERDGNQEVYVMNADGSGQTNLTNSPGYDADPNWSPDGTKIVFTTTRDGNTELYIMNADGSGQTNLTAHPSVDFMASWSPDGSKIVFTSHRAVGSEIYVINSNGTNPVRLTNNVANDYYPAWSPDGYKIAFLSNRHGNDELYLMNTDGSNPTRLTNSAGTDAEPAWSPDGSKIAFETDRTGNSEVFVINVDGSNPRNITNNSAMDRRAAWQPLPRTDLNRVSNFDGDAKSDISIWRPSDGLWAITNSSNGSQTFMNWGLGSLGDVPVPRDYDGDGKTDFAVFRPSDGAFYIVNSSTNTTRTAGGALSTDIPAPADYDGDGKTDPAVYRPSNGNWYSLDSTTNTISARVWVLPGIFIPPSDYDGDGKADLASFRHSDGNWFVRSAATGAVTVTHWGTNGDKPVPADYDGDRKTDLAVFRPSDTNWYIIKSSTGSNIIRQWGLSSDTLVPADFDGDGKADVAVWRSSTQEWYVLRSSDGALFSVTYGSSGDVPVPSTYIPN